MGGGRKKGPIEDDDKASIRLIFLVHGLESIGREKGLKLLHLKTQEGEGDGAWLAH